MEARFSSEKIQYTTRLREAKRGEEEKTEKWKKENRRNEME